MTATTATTTSRLETAGFTATEIAKLQELRASYNPFKEQCESNQEFERLNFLKWRYENGQLDRG